MAGIIAPVIEYHWDSTTNFRTTLTPFGRGPSEPIHSFAFGRWIFRNCFDCLSAQIEQGQLPKRYWRFKPLRPEHLSSLLDCPHLGSDIISRVGTVRRKGSSHAHQQGIRGVSG